jgi:hypothetical protein
MTRRRALAARKKRTAFEACYVLVGPTHWCAYCGEPADTIDHTVPVSFVCGHFRFASRHRFQKVQACRECNTLLGDRIFATFTERKAFLAEKYERRYREYLEAGWWTSEEIEELGRGLQAMVRQFDANMLRTKRRLVLLGDPGWPGKDVKDALFPEALEDHDRAAR